MKLKFKHDDVICVELSQHELIVINNALNEICNGISIPHFETRIGASVLEVEELLRDVTRIIDT
ncbi:MAG: hypothetical protein ACK5OR_05260 [Betaproteobacteria bacterium]